MANSVDRFKCSVGWHDYTGLIFDPEGRAFIKCQHCDKPLYQPCEHGYHVWGKWVTGQYDKNFSDGRQIEETRQKRVCAVCGIAQTRGDY